MEFPKDASTGKVSTTATNKAIWKAFLAPLTLQSSNVNDATATALSSYVKEALIVAKELEALPSKEWRHGYIPFVNRMVELQARATPEEALKMCQSALQKLHNTMLFRSQPLATVMSKNVNGEENSSTKAKISSRVIQGEKAAATELKAELPIPDEANIRDGASKNKLLSGEELNKQLDEWVEYGCMEKSAAKNAAHTAANLTPAILDDKVFVLLGATSELGPALPLAEWGATMVAISRPGSKLEALAEHVKSNTHATMIVPVLDTCSEGDDTTNEQKAGGVDVLQCVPEIAEWIVSLYPQKHLVLVPLIYLDGEANVRAVTAMDAILQHVLEERPSNETGLAFWVSPGTPHVISEEAALDAQQRYDGSGGRGSVPLWHSPFRLLPSFGFQRNAVSCQTYSTSTSAPHGSDESSVANKDKKKLYIYNGLADLQGPNYALSKCIQQWRAMVSAPQFADASSSDSNNNTNNKAWAVSANVSPPARTQSMVAGHPAVAAWLNGVEAFPPMTVFEPETARVLMTLLLLSDLTETEHDDSQTQTQTMLHPMELTVKNSVHGGCWRMPYDLNSVGTLSYVFGKFKR
jgi:hypothetical protein